MLTLVQSKIVTGGTVTLDSPVTVGNIIVTALSYSESVLRSNYPEDNAQITIIPDNGTVFNAGRGLIFFAGNVVNSGFSTLVWHLYGFSVPLITTILEFTNTPILDLVTDVSNGTTLAPVTFSSALVNDLLLYFSTSDSDSCVFSFPIGTLATTLNGAAAGALGSGYLVTTLGLKTISGFASAGTTQYLAVRLSTTVIGPTVLTIGCGTLVLAPVVG